MMEFILNGNYWAEKGEPGTEDWNVLYHAVEFSAYAKLKTRLEKMESCLRKIKSPSIWKMTIDSKMEINMAPTTQEAIVLDRILCLVNEALEEPTSGSSGND